MLLPTLSSSDIGSSGGSSGSVGSVGSGHYQHYNNNSNGSSSYSTNNNNSTTNIVTTKLSFHQIYNNHQSNNNNNTNNNTNKKTPQLNNHFVNGHPTNKLLKKIITILTDNEDVVNLKFQDYLNVRLVNKVFQAETESHFWKRAVNLCFLTNTPSENSLYTGNWKRCFILMTRIMHQKDWSLCPMCGVQPLGIITTTKQLACCDDEVCKFKISLGFNCSKQHFNNNNNNNNITNQHQHHNHNHHISNNRFNRMNNNNKYNDSSCGSTYVVGPSSCQKCKFKCKMCKGLVRGDMVSWKVMADEQAKRIENEKNNRQDEDDDDDEEEEDDEDEEEILIKCERCVQIFKDIHTSDDTIFCIEDLI